MSTCLRRILNRTEFSVLLKRSASIRWILHSSPEERDSGQSYVSFAKVRSIYSRTNTQKVIIPRPILYASYVYMTHAYTRNAKQLMFIFVHIRMQILFYKLQSGDSHRSFMPRVWLAEILLESRDNVYHDLGWYHKVGALRYTDKSIRSYFGFLL